MIAGFILSIFRANMGKMIGGLVSGAAVLLIYFLVNGHLNKHRNLIEGNALLEVELAESEAREEANAQLVAEIQKQISEIKMIEGSRISDISVNLQEAQTEAEFLRQELEGVSDADFEKCLEMDLPTFVLDRLRGETSE